MTRENCESPEVASPAREESQMKSGSRISLFTLVMFAVCVSAASAGQAQPKKPNILVIFGDDIGYFNIMAYNQGMMGYKTPNIDRMAPEATMMTDSYAQQSCLAGRHVFITGQSPFRTGLLKVGLPGADLGLKKEDPTIADLLKN